jgi:uncharacterized protein YsxB (DUF464 family)
MTTVVIRRNQKKEYLSFTCMGHAGFAKGKQDILCAAISILVINTVNTLEELAGEKLRVSQNEETGFIQCEFLEKLQEKSAFLLDAMVFGLKNLKSEYGDKYLQIRFEEV